MYNIAGFANMREVTIVRLTGRRFGAASAVIGSP